MMELESYAPTEETREKEESKKTLSVHIVHPKYTEKVTNNHSDQYTDIESYFKSWALMGNVQIVVLAECCRPVVNKESLGGKDTKGEYTFLFGCKEDRYNNADHG